MDDLNTEAIFSKHCWYVVHDACFFVFAYRQIAIIGNTKYKT